MWLGVSKMTGHVWPFVCLLAIVAADNHNITLVNATTDGHYDVIMPTNCTIEFKQDDVKLYRKLTTDTDNKLVYVHFQFTNHAGKLLHEYHGDLFEPLTWVYVSGRRGESFLNLLQQYEVMSLKTMSIGVEHATIDVTEAPTGCFTSQPMSVVGPYFRDSLMNNFEPWVEVNTTLSAKETSEESTDESIKVSVCHMTIGKEETVARFFYTCCHFNTHGERVCSELVTDSWMQVVMLFIIVTNILVIAFSPLLVPEYYYSDTKGSVSYTQDSETERKPLTILKTVVPKIVGARTNIISEKLLHQYMPGLSKTVQNLKKDKPSECDVGTIEFVVKNRDLISANDVPVGIFTTIYNNLARCEIRHHTSMLECCNGNMFAYLGCSVQWYECLSRLMTTVVLVIVAIPWIFRVIFYTMYEQEHFAGRATAAEAHHLEKPYLANLSLYLSPLHAVFLVCYFVIIIEGMCLGMLQRKVTQNLRLLFRKCFQDMRHTSRSECMSSVCKYLLLPCTKCGIFGLILFPLVWVLVLPVLLIMAAFYYLPIVNLTCRLIWSLLTDIFSINVLTQVCLGGRPKSLDIEKLKTKPSRGIECLIKLRNVVLTGFCLMALYSFLLLLVEFVQFVVVVAIYTLMGVIINSSFAMQYVPLLFMLTVYGHTTFGGVYKKYMIFNKTIHKHVVDIFKKTSTTAQVELVQSDSNTAFEVIPEVSSDSKKDFLSVKNSNITWTSKRTVLFVDKYGTPYIRKKFFFECCKMDHYAAPGSLFSNLMAAVFKLSLIISFLVFVGLVVVVFSENFKLSGTNQTLIALAGGLIPFVLTNFLFREVELPTVEDDIRFNRLLNKVIDNYQEEFKVLDCKCLESRDDDTVIGAVSDTQIDDQTDTGTQNDTQSNGTTPKSTGTNGHVIKTFYDAVFNLSSNTTLLGSSPALDTINQYADDSGDLPEKEDEQSFNQGNNDIERMPNGQKQSDNQTTQRGGAEIICEQPSEPSLSNKTLQDSASLRSSSLSSVMKTVEPAHHLRNYDLVVDLSSKITVTEYLISLI